jgi:hypothetical protein
MAKHIGGVVAAKDRFLEELEASASDGGGATAPLFRWQAVEDLRRRMADASRQVAELCLNQGVEPADLAAPSRRAFQLISFLAEGRHLEEHLQALRHLASSNWTDGRLVARLDHSGSLYRIERRAESTRLVVSEGFVGAPEAVLQALARLAIPYARKRQPRRLVREYVEGERFAEVLRQVETAGGAYRSRPVGMAYDLRDLFDGVNEQYFGGALVPPRLLWSERVPSVEFGHYEPATDTVRLSRRLDSAAVPRFVLEHVLRHELLHRILGAERRGDRRRYHSVRFRREEKRFPRYREAEAFLEKLAKSGRSAR